MAEVVLHLGRYHLVVNGLYVAMEGDPCRDPLFEDRVWTKRAMEDAMVAINYRRWESAADRMQRGTD